MNNEKITIKNLKLGYIVSYFGLKVFLFFAENIN